MITSQIFAASLTVLSFTAGIVLQHPRTEFIPVASTAPEKILPNSRVGCRTADIWNDAAKMESSDKYLLDKLKTGYCTLLPPGTVRVEKSSSEGQIPALSCVKPVGFKSCWWIRDDLQH